jgi:hypothetical protein
MNTTDSIPFKILFIVILTFTLIYGGFEFYSNKNAPEKADPGELISESLELSEEIFRENYLDFTENTLQLKNRIEEIISESVSRQLVHREMQTYPFMGKLPIQKW